jgi:hypothetical protein
MQKCIILAVCFTQLQFLIAQSENSRLLMQKSEFEAGQITH